jgi:hypothetical protein
MRRIACFEAFPQAGFSGLWRSGDDNFHIHLLFQFFSLTGSKLIIIRKNSHK